MRTSTWRMARWGVIGIAALAAAGGYLATATPGLSATLGRPGLTRPVSTREAAASQRSGCPIKVAYEFLGSAYIIGYSNASKFRESTLLGPGLGGHPRAALEGLHNRYVITDSCNNKLYSYVTGILDYQGRPQLPPSRSTFLAFGFMPTTATLELTEVPLKAGCRDLLGHQIAPAPIYTCLIATQTGTGSTYIVKVTSAIEIHVLSVTVNGAKLPVGPGCQTASPVPLILTANGQKQYDVTKGGLLTGNIIIGRLTGCGDVTPLLTASLSDVKDLVKITQGPMCVKNITVGGHNNNCLVLPGPGHPWGIPKFVPKPLR